MARIPFVAGNWKMNSTKATAVELAKAVAKGAGSDVQVGMAPPFVYLDAVGQAISGSAALLGAQDVYFEKNGAFTGEISCDMLKDLAVKFVLTGHSERRHVLHEPSALVARKAAAVCAAGFILVHCVGERIEERDAGKTLSVVQSHLDELAIGVGDPSRLVIAYEPVWAIGTGRVATDAQAQEVHAFIREALAKRYNKDFADQVRIQYGGSMKPDNAKGLLDQPDVDGGLIGGASLKADQFLAIVNAALTGAIQFARCPYQGSFVMSPVFGIFFHITLALFLLLCLILILLVLIQKGRGGGLSSAFGGSGGNTAFGAKTGDVLTWATSIIFGLFIVLAVVLNLLSQKFEAPTPQSPQQGQQTPANPGNPGGPER